MLEFFCSFTRVLGFCGYIVGIITGVFLFFGVFEKDNRPSAYIFAVAGIFLIFTPFMGDSTMALVYKNGAYFIAGVGFLVAYIKKYFNSSIIMAIILLWMPPVNFLLNLLAIRLARG